MLDKYGKCPNCNEDWNSGDIKKVVENINMFAHKTDYEVGKIAQSYGWTEFNKGSFSSLKIIHTDNSKDVGQCPNIRCGHFFDLDTANEYCSINDAINNINEIVRE